MALRILIRCDAGPQLGVGHLVRCLALRDELAARGVSVELLGSVTGVPWVEEQIRQRGLPVGPAPSAPAELARLAVAKGAAAVVLDGYSFDPGCGAALRAAGVVVLAVQDGTFGAEQEADLRLDQNLGAEVLAEAPHPAGSVVLGGLEYVLFRDQILRYRRTTTVPPTRHLPPRVLAVFGGTDAYGAGPVLVELLLATGRPVHVTAIAATPQLGESMAAVPRSSGQIVQVCPPTPHLAQLAASCDLAVTAAGSSVWEFLCLGVPAGLVCVTENQRLGYDVVVGRQVAAGLGHLDDLRELPEARDAAVAALSGLLEDEHRRAALSAAGMSLVDGHGRQRVVDALLVAIDRSR